MAIWLAKIVRVVAAFSVKTTLQAFKPQDMGPAERNIETALAFWPNGVKRIVAILDRSVSGSLEIEITWNKVLPGLMQDGLYTLFLVIASYGAIHFLEWGSDEMLKQLRPTWLVDFQSNDLIPGKGAAGITIGTRGKDVVERFGKPPFIEQKEGFPPAYYTYKSGELELGIKLSPEDIVEGINIYDGKFGQSGALPSMAKAALGNTEDGLISKLGNPISRRNFTFNGCQEQLGDPSAVVLFYQGIQFILCGKNNRAILVKIVK